MFPSPRRLTVLSLLMLLGLLGLPCAGRAGAAPVQLQLALRPDVTVSGAELVLADVAEVAGAEPALVATLRALRIGSAPRVGYVERYARADLERLMRTRVLPDGVALRWSGAAAVQVHAAQRMLEAGALAQAAEQGLRQQLGSAFAGATLRVTGAPKEVPVPLGQVSLSTRVLAPGPAQARRAVWVDIAVEGKPVRSVVVPFSVSLVAPAYVARRELAAGTMAGPADFDQSPLEVAELVDTMLAPPQLGGPVRLTRALARGQVLLRSQLAQPGMVYRGDVLSVRVAEGGVVVEARAVAQQDGGMGQLIRIKPDSSNEAISARVIASGIVQAEGK